MLHVWAECRLTSAASLYQLTRTTTYNTYCRHVIYSPSGMPQMISLVSCLLSPCYKTSHRSFFPVGYASRTTFGWTMGSNQRHMFISGERLGINQVDGGERGGEGRGGEGRRWVKYSIAFVTVRRSRSKRWRQHREHLTLSRAYYTTEPLRSLRRQQVDMPIRRVIHSVG